jgi:putative component of toxin-antitoxin plasmid stabilization module
MRAPVQFLQPVLRLCCADDSEQDEASLEATRYQKAGNPKTMAHKIPEKMKALQLMAVGDRLPVQSGSALIRDAVQAATRSP